MEAAPNSTTQRSEDGMVGQKDNLECSCTLSEKEDVNKKDAHPPSNKNVNGYSDEKVVMTTDGGRYARGVYYIQSKLQQFYMDHETQIWFCIKITLAIVYFIYFGFAMAYSFGDEDSIRLLIVTILGTLFIVTKIVWHYCADCCMWPYRRIEHAFKSMSASQKKNYARVKTWFYALLTIGYAIFAIVWVIVDVGLTNPENLIPAAGIAVFILTFYLTSYNPAAVKWRPVLWGLYVQFAFALLILRWETGFKAFSWLGDRVQEFLAHTDAGVIFVFGESYVNHYFAFKVLPIIVFFSTIISVLYYWGVMQFIIRYIARALALALGTSPAESLNAAGNIFLGMFEAVLMIRPFMSKLTNSELHAVMTAGFATIAGSVLGAYINIGIPANHLIAASAMSAPAALVMSKLSYPETEENKTRDDVYKTEGTQHANVLAAASDGASTSIGLVSNIAASFIGFIAALSFVNATLTWCGHRVGWYDPELTFELICSYALWPVAYLMGVHAKDCRKVAELIGVKTFLNEFVAYTRLSELIKNKELLIDYTKSMQPEGSANATCVYIKDDIYLNATNTWLIGGVLSGRSEVIATYALCGFSNLAFVGITIGVMPLMAPDRRTDITKMAVRAMMAGNAACFITACIAGRISAALFGAASPRRLAEDTQQAPSPSHIILTPGQPVAALTPFAERQAKQQQLPLLESLV